MVPTPPGDFAELIRQVEAYFGECQVVEHDHTPRRSILVAVCRYGTYTVRITEIVDQIQRKYRYYVLKGDEVIAGFDNAADPRAVQKKYGRSYRHHIGELIPHLHLENKSKLALTEEMTVSRFVDWLRVHLPLTQG